MPEILEGLIDLRPSVEPVIFDDLGHYPQVEDPDRFTAVLTETVGAGPVGTGTAAAG